MGVAFWPYRLKFNSYGPALNPALKFDTSMCKVYLCMHRESFRLCPHVLGPQSLKFMSHASKQPHMRLIQGSASCKEFCWPSTGGTQPHFSALGASRKVFLTPLIIFNLFINVTCTYVVHLYCLIFVCKSEDPTML